MKSLFILVFSSYVCSVSADVLDASQLSTRLIEIKNGIGVDDIQAEFNKIPYIAKTSNGTVLLSEIQNHLVDSLTTLQSALTAVKSEIVNNEEKFSTDAPLPMCCDKTGTYVYDPKFRKEVDKSTACVTKSPVASTNAKYPRKEISDVMKEQYNNNRNVLWQHYGTTEGVSVVYPSIYWEDCAEYEPRFRSAFAATASPKDKDVVIILDASSSMKIISGDQTRTKMVIAKDAARTVVQTLNPNDRIAVLSFSTEVKTPSDPENNCFDDTLAFASKSNIDKLKEYVNTITVSTFVNSNFEKALRKGFSYFGSSNWTADVSQRDQVILFLTDGGSDEGEDPRDVIRDENAKLQNRVIILTYLLGPMMENDVKTQLNEMASQLRSNSSYGSIRAGLYTYVDQTQHGTLSMKMATFYVHLLNDIRKPIYTIPYVDPFSEIGLITSMCISVYVLTGLHGVACTDVKLSELLKEIEYFEEGNSSYGFVIDGTGRVLVHPLLPDTKFVEKNEDPVLVDITTLERSSGSAGIINSMKKGKTGSKTLSAVYFTIPRGRLVNDGSTVIIGEATYYWGQVPGTNFVVCIVLGKDAYSDITETNFPISPDERANVFMYHNRSLSRDTFQDCRFNSRKVTLAKSSIKLTPSAFSNPFEYIDKDETAVDVDGYEKYFTAQTNQNPGFKTNVRPTLWATLKAETIWKEKQSSHLAWRYIGTTAGFIRVYPGVSLAKNYDHEKRTWWRQTTAHQGIIHITPPYKDAWGSGVLNTFSHTIHNKESSQVIAVVGTDFPLEYFSWLIDQIFPMCLGNTYKCMIIDDSGFLVMHQSFKDTRDDSSFDNPTHITVQEPVIAKAMLQQNVLNSHPCQDLSVNKELKTYRVTLPQDKSLGLDFADTGDAFELKPVAETNIFILRIKTGSALDSTTASCTCDSQVKPDSRLCNCDCLCYTRIVSNVCKNVYNISTADSSLPCSARLLDTSSIFVDESFSELAACYDPKCSDKTSKSDCYSESQCSWCEFTDTGNIIEEPCCRLKGECSFGKTKASNRDVCDAPRAVSLPPDPGSKSPSAGLIVGVVIGVIVIIVLVVLGVIFIMRHRAAEKDSDHYLSAIPDMNDIREYSTHTNNAFVATPHDPPNGSNSSSNYDRPTS